MNLEIKEIQDLVSELQEKVKKLVAENEGLIERNIRFSKLIDRYAMSYRIVKEIACGEVKPLGDDHLSGLIFKADMLIAGFTEKEINSMLGGPKGPSGVEND